MSHEEFLAFVRSVLGPLPHIDAREKISNLIKTKGYTFRFEDRCIPKGTLGSNPNNPLIKIDGIRLEMGSCNSDAFTVYVPEDNRK